MNYDDAVWHKPWKLTALLHSYWGTRLNQTVCQSCNFPCLTCRWRQGTVEHLHLTCRSCAGDNRITGRQANLSWCLSDFLQHFKRNKKQQLVLRTLECVMSWCSDWVCKQQLFHLRAPWLAVLHSPSLPISSAHLPWQLLTRNDRRSVLITGCTIIFFLTTIAAVGKQEDQQETYRWSLQLQ